jgi:hypothetical protein
MGAKGGSDRADQPGQVHAVVALAEEVEDCFAGALGGRGHGGLDVSDGDVQVAAAWDSFRVDHFVQAEPQVLEPGHGLADRLGLPLVAAARHHDPRAGRRTALGSWCVPGQPGPV